MKCSKHPTYKAMRKPTADCAECRFMWEIAQMSPEDVEQKRKEVESRRRITSSNSSGIFDDVLEFISDILD